MKLLLAQEMRHMDGLTMKAGLPGTVLMDRAANGALRAFLDYFRPSPSASIGLFCGTGNNGGDGVAMALGLYNRGFSPRLLRLGPLKSCAADAQVFWKTAETLLPEELFLEASCLRELQEVLPQLADLDFYIDALLGTGLDRPVEGRYAEAIAFLKSRKAPLFALDIPSGLHADSGQILGDAPKVQATASFGFRKIGHCLDPARSLCGTLFDIDIQIPKQIQEKVGFSATGLDEEWLRSKIMARPRDFHKGRAGRILLIGGRAPTTGAIALSAEGALVGGGGLISVLTSTEALHHFSPEVMAAPVFDQKGTLGDKSREIEVLEVSLKKALEKAERVVLGPGLGIDDLSSQTLEIVLKSSPEVLILDADGLTLLAEDQSLRDLARAFARERALIVTPHPGECSRLLNSSTETILKAPIEAAQELADNLGATAVVKTAATIIATGKSSLAINLTGNPGMATGGMGDALTGLIASLWTEFPNQPHLVACAAVALHGLAGDRGAQKKGHRGLTVRALLDEVGPLWQALEP